MGGKVPRWRGRGPRTHDLQRPVRGFAVLWLITAPNTDLFVDVLQHIRSFRTDQGVEAHQVSESIGTALFFLNYIGTPLFERIRSARSDVPVRHAHTRLEPHHDGYVTQRLRSHRVLAQVSFPNAQLD